MRKIVIPAVLLVLILLSATVFAAFIIPANENAKENSRAPEHSPVIDDNWGLERVDFVHYAKPDGVGSNKKPKRNVCYKLMGVKWKSTPVNYSINPTNTDGLSEEFVTQTVSTAAETWDAETTTELFNDNYVIDYSAQYGVQDYKNSIAFDTYPQANAIAVTSVWYTRKGKQIVEFDIVFNTNFDWGNADLDATKMDLQNIAVHELGHSVGLADIYTDPCSTVTMYGYSTEGETSKRTLGTADITGLESMYGS